MSPPLDVDDLWEHAPCGHIVTDGAGRILRVNATVLAWLGHEHDALRGT